MAATDDSTLKLGTFKNRTQGGVYLVDLALDESMPPSSDIDPAGIVFLDPLSKGFQTFHSIFTCL